MFGGIGRARTHAQAKPPGPPFLRSPCRRQTRKLPLCVNVKLAFSNVTLRGTTTTMATATATTTCKPDDRACVRAFVVHARACVLINCRSDAEPYGRLAPTAGARNAITSCSMPAGGRALSGSRRAGRKYTL